jgi:hypothetical protein
LHGAALVPALERVIAERMAGVGSLLQRID